METEIGLQENNNMVAISIDNLKEHALKASHEDHHLPEQTIRERFDYVVSEYMQQNDKGRGRDIALYGEKDEYEWENLYLAARLINSCKGIIRIQTQSLPDTVYNDPIILAHLRAWINSDSRNSIRILVANPTNAHDSLLYKSLRLHMRSHTDEERVQIRSIAPDFLKENDIDKYLDVRGALFGHTGFKFSDKSEENPLYVGNFDSPDVVSEVAELYDTIFDSQKCVRDLESDIRHKVQITSGTAASDTASPSASNAEPDYVQYLKIVKKSILETGNRRVMIPQQFNRMITNLEEIKRHEATIREKSRSGRKIAA